MIPNFRHWPRRNLDCHDCEETTAHLLWPDSPDRWVCARCGASRMGDDARDEELWQEASTITSDDIWGKK